MKKYLFITLLLLATTLFGTTFSLLTEGKYDEAAVQLKAELQKEPSDALALYNLGVLSEKQGKIGDAVFYYIQTLSIAPTFSEAHNNLNIIADRQNLAIPKRVQQPTKLLHSFFLLMAVFSLFVLLLIWLMFRPHWKIRVALIPVVLIILLLSSWFVGKYSDYQESSFAVVRIANDLKSGPDRALSTVGSLKEGEVIRILAISGKWCKVESVQDNVEGWVSYTNLGIIQRSYR
ncbi:hypothetical protein KAH37_00325 [bacterium]|nr:hypothetical protein [bacterium]